MSTTLGSVIIEGVLSSRPPAGSLGRIYFGTDTKKHYYDNGTSWDDVTCVPAAFVGDTGSGGAAGAVPAPAAGDAAANKFLKADGSFEKLPVATTSAVGVVEPDGVTVDVDGTGKISVPTATSSALGLVKPDGTTITIDGTGKISAAAGGPLTNPMTTEGDIIYGGASGAPTRLPAGAAGQVLQTNGTSAAPSWVTGGGGGGFSGDILSPNKPTGTLASQKNEYATVAAGATINLLNYTGGDGYVDRLFIALAGTAGSAVGLNMTINIYYNGEGTPTVSVPIYNFFLSVYCVSGSTPPAYFANRFIGFNSPNSTDSSYYSFIPIPFAGSIKIDLVNNESGSFQVFSMAEYQAGVANTTWTNTRKLRVATYNASGLAMNSVSTLVNYSGSAGRLLGLWMLDDEVPGSISPKGAPLEGNVKLYLDGAATPNVESSGTEDWFGMGFYFGAHGASNPAGGGGIASQIGQGWTGNGEIGVTYIGAGAGGFTTNSAYRFHVDDKRNFASGLKITWNCGDSTEVSFTGTDTVWFTVFYYTAS